MTSLNSDSPQEAGATPVIMDPNDTCFTVDKDGERKKHGYHHFVWIWNDDVWTDDVRCTTCGVIRNYTRNEL